MTTPKSSKTLLLGFLLSIPLAAGDIEGYPYNVINEMAKYECDAPLQVAIGMKATENKEASQLLLCLAKDFTPQAKGILRRAFFHLFDRLQEKSFFACIDHGLPAFHRPEYLKNEARYFEHFVQIPFRLRKLKADFGLPPYIFISSISDGENPLELGAGYLDFFESGARSKEMLPLISLAARGGLIGSKTIPQGSSIPFWGAVLGMSFAKNLGLNDVTQSLSTSPFHVFARCLISPSKEEPK